MLCLLKSWLGNDRTTDKKLCGTAQSVKQALHQHRTLTLLAHSRVTGDVTMRWGPEGQWCSLIVFTCCFHFNHYSCTSSTRTMWLVIHLVMNTSRLSFIPSFPLCFFLYLFLASFLFFPSIFAFSLICSFFLSVSLVFIFSHVYFSFYFVTNYFLLIFSVFVVRFGFYTFSFISCVLYFSYFSLCLFSNFISFDLVLFFSFFLSRCYLLSVCGVHLFSPTLAVECTDERWGESHSVP